MINAIIVISGDNCAIHKENSRYSRAIIIAIGIFIWPTANPLVFAEIKAEFNLLQAMNNGLIVSHYFSDSPDDDLRAYVGQYLTEEIAAEGITRNIPAFARFLEVAATSNTNMLNFSSVASDAQVNRQTVKNYFQILIDTLVGYFLPSFQETKKRKSIGMPKFYFFDMGVVRSLRGLGPITRNSADFGDFFEHLIFLELWAYQSYHQPNLELTYWRSRSGFEVDFILGRLLAVEVKASNNISAKHLRGLKAFSEDVLCDASVIVCQESSKRVLDGILIYPWQDFLSDLWAGKWSV